MKQILLVLIVFCLLPTLNQAQFRGKLQYTFIGETTQDMKIDLMGNYKVKVKNISATSVSRIITEFHGLNGDGSVVTTGGGGFAVFPNGGFLYLNPGDSVTVQGWSAGWFECTNCALATGSNSKKVRFMFSQDGNNDRDTVIQDITLINNLDATVNALSYVTGGTYNIKGTFKIPAYIKDSIQELRFFLQNSNGNNRDWQITPNATVVSAFGDVYYHFNFNATNRSDWRIQVRPMMKPGIKWFVPNTNISLTGSGTSFYARVAPFGVGNFAIDSVKTYTTATGFWRGVFVPSDSSLIAFPGQENWNNPNVNRLNSRMYKLKLNNANFGDTSWSYLIGDETWGGDASKDGRYAIYMLNQGGMNRTNASIDWAGIINAQTGQKIWGSGGNHQGPSFSGLEVGMSKDGRYFAVGSSGDGIITLYQNNHAVSGTPTVTQLWVSTGSIGQVRKLVFSDDGQHLYAGSGDMYLGKFKVSDGSLVWRAYIGGWPFINGLKFSVDSTFIYTGTKSKDVTKINVQTGAVSWTAFSSNLDVHNSRNGRYLMDFSGQLFDNSNGAIIGKIQPSSQKAFAYLDDFVISADREIGIYHPFGSLHATRNTFMNDGGGEQSQFMWSDTAGTKVVVLARDMVSNGPPKKGIGLWRITPSINRYPIMDSIRNFSLNIGDSVYTILRYSDRDAHTLSATTSSSLSKLIFRTGTNDTLWIKAANGFSGTDTATVRISETATAERLSAYNLFTVTVSCGSTTATATAATAATFCSGENVILNANTGTGFTYQWLKDTVAISGATAAAYTATTNGSYTVKVTNNVGCTATSNAITVTVKLLPPTPTIVRDTANNLVSSASSGNVWYKDGVALSSDTSQKFKPTTVGNYTVKSTQNGCASSMSAVYYYLVTAVLNFSNNQYLKLYPNPVQDELRIDYKLDGQYQLSLYVYDLNGKLVLTKHKMSSGSTLSLKNLSGAVYLVRINDKNGKLIFTDKIIKE